MSNRYEQNTFSYLLARALGRVPDTLDKRQGSIIYDAIAPACYELAEIYQELDALLDLSFADTATGTYLTMRAAEMGITREAASAAIRTGEFNIAVAIGSRFSINDVAFVVIDTLTGTDRKLQCEEVGVIGNAYTGAMIPIDYIDGLITANLTTVLIPGEDEESDENLRIRYFENLASQSFGGNISDYKEKTKALAGVGGCKVYPVWAGGGTVKLVITDSTDLVPSAGVVDSVQTAIDPIANAGEGLGIAPIGHIVTVVAATGLTVDIATSVSFQIGYVWADVEPYVIAAVEAHLAGLRADWDQLAAITVRISQIESVILQITGIVDITGTTLNSVASNLVLTDVSIPILGVITNS